MLRDVGVHIRLRRYHKGLKHTLYRAAVKRYLEPVCTERLARLAQIDQALPTAHRVRALLRAYVAPHLHLCADPAAAYYLRLKARLGSEPRVIVNELFAEFIDPVRDQYLQALGDVLSIHAMDDHLIRAFGGIVLLMASMPCDVFHGSMAGRDHVPIAPAVMIDKVVVMGTASFLHIPASRRLKKNRGIHPTEQSYRFLVLDHSLVLALPADSTTHVDDICMHGQISGGYPQSRAVMIRSND